ncbi:helix-turn-helix domain containing protein [Arthrobacter sp. ATA002]|uniref:TetR/AcrR family transcriptional regulator n=1 Tax=Arthrobacter sp. ATA002 TaxID=2991715 RepID=UPI0022A803B2|nr:helix-turn-helix domain-containing protein [Arthrobacter sp. ATA002]WAP52224.1 helix-turn-helix domain containing protein [Arthrobacter sp. ATA002]
MGGIEEADDGGTGGHRPGGGLRARKRAAARSTIERAAVTLVLERGYERVTVDMICASGMVSPRTFFNYFGSKEGVFLGPALPRPAKRLPVPSAGRPVPRWSWGWPKPYSPPSSQTRPIPGWPATG